MISFKFKITLSIFIKTSKQHFDRNFCRKKNVKLLQGFFIFQIFKHSRLEHSKQVVKSCKEDLMQKFVKKYFQSNNANLFD
jgi:hypothetical protein